MTVKKNIPLLLFLLVSTWMDALWAQEMVPPRDLYTPQQMEMIEEQKLTIKSNRDVFRNSLSEEQKNLLKNASLSLKERQQELMKTLSAEQKLRSLQQANRKMQVDHEAETRRFEMRVL